MKRYLDYAKAVIRLEAEAVAGLAEQLDEQFIQSIEAILACRGRVVICGMGKSGLIGRKIAATLASTGTPAFFMHPGEAYHGDLGMLAPDDLFVGISNSGETEEVLRLVSFLQENNNVLIAMTGNPDSTLAKNATFHLSVRVAQEACPLQLAPTSSTTATLAMGDALAVALMQAREFSPESFARFHPGGSLGRKLLTRVSHVMYKENLPVVTAQTGIKDVINTMTEGRLGLVVVTDQAQIVQGVFTDGDLRRAMESHGDALFSKTAGEVMSAGPKSITSTARLVEAEELMNRHKITSLLVIDAGRFVGVVQIYRIYERTQ